MVTNGTKAPVMSTLDQVLSINAQNTGGSVQFSAMVNDNSPQTSSSQSTIDALFVSIVLFFVNCRL